MLSEQQQVAPDLPALVGAAAGTSGALRIVRFGPLVPQRQQIGGARRELRGAVARQLHCGRGRAILPVQSAVPAPDRKLRPEPALHVSEEVLRAARHDAREGVASPELLEILHQALVHERVVPLGAVQERHIIRVARRDQHRVREQPVGQTPRHRFGAHVESETQGVAVVVGAPVEHTTTVRSFPPVELRVWGPLAKQLVPRGLRLGQQWHGALRIRTAREIAHPARREHGREGERLAGHVGDLRAQVTKTPLAGE